MVNLNKIFPRLTISAKLAIAFVLIAVVPLAVISVLGTYSAMTELRSSTRLTLEHDIDMAQARTGRALREIEHHVSFIEKAAARDVLLGDGAASVELAQRLAYTYLEADSSALFRLSVIDTEGELRLVAESRSEVRSLRPGTAADPLYRWMASELPRDGQVFLPIELRAVWDTAEVVAAIALIVPVFDGDQQVGAVIGEASAEQLFTGLSIASPGLADGTTGLVDQEGRFLYHSERKPGWGKLFSTDAGETLADEFPEAVIASMRAAQRGSLQLDDGRDVSFRRLAVGRFDPVGGSDDGSFLMYRALPSEVLDARVRGFLLTFTMIGALLGLMVLGISTIAAKQIAQPIYRLRAAAREISGGGSPTPVLVATNDEIEDLAKDFNAMAGSLSLHRRELEALVADRTRRLAETEAHLGQIVTDAADAILGLAPDGTITLWNSAAQELFGYTEDDVLGLDAADVLGPTEKENAAEAGYVRRMVEQGETVVNHRTKRRARDGTWIPVTMTKSVLRNDHGEVVGHSLILRDDRARERLEEQMRRSERLSAVSVMAGGIAHELNNPLSVIANRIELMQREAKSNGADLALLRDLEVLHRHVDRIGGVTRDLLRFARDDSDQMIPIDVNEVVGRVQRLLNKVFESGGIALELDLAKGSPVALANESAIETILVNLLLNARQATPTGGLVRVVTRTDGGRVEVEVRDGGPGIPSELRRRIFEPFFTTKAAEGGTGLGLAVCRALADRLGGTLDLLQLSGAGAVFRVTLPKHVGMVA